MDHTSPDATNAHSEALARVKKALDWRVPVQELYQALDDLHTVPFRGDDADEDSAGLEPAKTPPRQDAPRQDPPRQGRRPVPETGTPAQPDLTITIAGVQE